MKFCFKFCLFIFFIAYLQVTREVYAPKRQAKMGRSQDPFSALGIPDLNPKALLSEIDTEGKHEEKKGFLQLRTIEDLPKFLANSNLSEDDGIQMLTKFLIQDDITLKKYGAVYDQTGFDGLPSGEKPAPPGSNERLLQRCRSGANIWFKEKMKTNDYDAYGGEEILDEIIPNWRVYKVLLIGKKGESTFVKICLPLDESLTALCSDQDEPCSDRAKYVEKEKNRNEDYIQKIKSNNFFGKKQKGMDMVKLLPGEKMIYKDKNATIVMDSHTQQKMASGMFNPPKIDRASKNDRILQSFKKKHLSNVPGVQQFPQFITPGQMNNIPNDVMMNILSGSNGMMMNGMNFGGNGMNLINNMSNMGMMNGMGMNFMNGGMGNMNNGMNFMNNMNNMNLGNMGNTGNINNNNDISKLNNSPQSIKTQNFALNHRESEAKPANDFRFKQTTNNNINSAIPNEIMDMRSQLAKMMESLKEKEQKIQMQNQQLSQFMQNNPNNLNSSMNANQQGNNMQGMPMSNQQIQFQGNGFMNNYNNMPNMNAPFLSNNLPQSNNGNNFYNNPINTQMFSPMMNNNMNPNMNQNMNMNMNAYNSNNVSNNPNFQNANLNGGKFLG